MLKKYRTKRWTARIIRRNLNSAAPIDSTQYIHDLDKKALSALEKIPLLKPLCSKVITLITDKQNTIINMSSMVHITENQLSKIYFMVQSICKKIGIEMPDLYLKMNRTLNAYTYGAEKFTIVIHSGLLECLEDDELYAVLAHECGHIACKHGLYNTIAGIVLDGGIFGLNELKDFLNSKGILGALAGGVVSLVDSALEIAFYHWNRCSELSADRIAAICCGSADPVIKTMMRLAGGTSNIDDQIDKDLFMAQAAEYKKSVENDNVNKALEFLLTKNSTHPLLALRAYEIREFSKSDAFMNAVK